MIILYIKSL